MITICSHGHGLSLCSALPCSNSPISPAYHLTRLHSVLLKLSTIKHCHAQPPQYLSIAGYRATHQFHCLAKTLSCSSIMLYWDTQTRKEEEGRATHFAGRGSSGRPSHVSDVVSECAASALVCNRQLIINNMI